MDTLIVSTTKIIAYNRVDEVDVHYSIYTPKNQRLKKIPLEKVRLIKANELNLTQVELF